MGWMIMYIYSITLHQFRNYLDLQLKLHPQLNIFWGRNAQGKTNLLEAIYYASLGTSYRLKNDADLINTKADGAHIEIIFRRLDVENSIDLQLFKRERKKITLNGMPGRQRDLPSNLLTVLFSPEDLAIIKGAPAQRRRFLDIELSQIDRHYYVKLVEYNRLIAQRNNLLKRILHRQADWKMLAVWDVQLVECAAFLWDKRRQAVSELSQLAENMQTYITEECEKLQMKYQCKGFNEQKNPQNIAVFKELYASLLEQNREKDIQRGYTSFGPHHDDVQFYLNDIPMKNFASQGQQRSAVLSLKLAETMYIYAKTQQLPILLLDDVMSELDVLRREKMLSYIIKQNIQTIITATEKELFPQNATSYFYQVEAGKVVPE